MRDPSPLSPLPIRWKTLLPRHPKHLEAVLWFQNTGYYGTGGLSHHRILDEFGAAMKVGRSRAYGLIAELEKAGLIHAVMIGGQIHYTLTLDALDDKEPPS